MVVVYLLGLLLSLPFLLIALSYRGRSGKLLFNSSVAVFGLMWADILFLREHLVLGTICLVLGATLSVISFFLVREERKPIYRINAGPCSCEDCRR